MSRFCIYLLRGDYLLALLDYKYVRANPFRRAPRAYSDAVFGMKVVRLTVEISRNGRCRRSVKAFLRLGADAVCFSEGFPVKELFPSREAGNDIAYEHMLPEIIARHGFEGETALLVAGPDPRSIQMLELLVQRYRYVLTDGLPRSELERLRRTVGASVIEAPPPELVADASLAVFMRGSDVSLPDKCVAVAADMRHLERVRYHKYVEPPELDAVGETPDGFSRQSLLSEALRRGAIQRSGIMLGACQILTNQCK